MKKVIRIAVLVFLTLLGVAVYNWNRSFCAGSLDHEIKYLLHCAITGSASTPDVPPFTYFDPANPSY